MTSAPFTIHLESPLSAEKARATIGTSADPTGTAPEWTLTARFARPASDAVWHAGSWDGGYTPPVGSKLGTAVAVSPALVGTLTAAAGQSYDVWVRWTVPGETPVRRAGTLTVAA